MRSILIGNGDQPARPTEIQTAAPGRKPDVVRKRFTAIPLSLLDAVSTQDDPFNAFAYCNYVSTQPRKMQEKNVFYYN